MYILQWGAFIFRSEVHAQIEHFSERYTSIFHGEVHVLLTLRYMYCTFRSEVHVLYRSCTRMLFACALYPCVVCLVHFKFVNTADDCTYIVYYCIHTVQYCMQDGGRVELQNIDKNSVFPIITVKTGNTQCMHRCTPFGVYLQWTKEIHITFYSHMFLWLNKNNKNKNLVLFNYNLLKKQNTWSRFLLCIVHKCIKRMERGAMICGNSGKSIAILYVVILTMHSNYDTARYRRLSQQPV